MDTFTILFMDENGCHAYEEYIATNKKDAVDLFYKEYGVRNRVLFVIEGSPEIEVY